MELYSLSFSSSSKDTTAIGFICRGFILPTSFPCPPEQSIHFPSKLLQSGLYSDSGSITNILLPI